MDDGSTEAQTQERLYRLVAENSVDVIVVARDGVMRWLSPSLTRTLGWRPEQWQGHRFEEFTHPDDVPLARQRREEIAAGAERVTRLRVRDSAGSWRWIESHAGPTAEGAGDATDIVGIFRVIDEVVAAEQSLAEAEQRYRLIAENSADVVIHTAEGVLLWVSPSIQDVTGWAPEELIGKTTVHLWHPDDRATAIRQRDSTYAGQPSRGTLRLQCKDGTWIWVEVSLKPYEDADGRIGAVGALRDVTSAVSAKRELEAERQRLRAMFGSMLEPHVLLRAIRDDAGNIVDFEYADANPAAAEYMGTTVVELVGRRVLQMWPGPVGAEIVETYARWLDEHRPVELDDWAYPHQQPGQERFFDVRGNQVGDDLLFAWRDVTERHRSMARIERSEHDYRLLAENAADLILLLNADDRVTWVSPSVHRLLGFHAEVLLGGQREILDPADADRVADVLGALRAGERAVVSTEVRLRHRHGPSSWWSLVARRASDEPATSDIVVALVNIEAEVRAREAALAEQSMRLAALDSMLDPHVLLRAVYDTDGGIVDFVYADANVAACEYMGLRREELVGSRLLGLMPAHARTGLFDAYVRTLETGDPLTLDDFEYPHETLADVRRYDIRGVRVGDALSLTWGDVTERHEAAQRLAESEARYRILAENSADVVVQAALDRTILWISPSVEEMLGRKPEDLVGTSTADLVHPEDKDWFVTQTTRVAASGDDSRLRVRLGRKDGTYVWVEVAGRQVPESPGRPPTRVIRLRDIDAEQAAVEALEKAHEQYRLLAENATDVVFRTDAQGVITFCSDGIKRLLGRRAEEVVGTRAMDYVHPDDRIGLEAFTHAEGRLPPVRARLMTPDGKPLWVEFNARGVVDQEGRAAGLVGGWHDVDAEVRAYEELDRRARTDALTGLVNREEAFRRLAAVMGHAPRTGDRLAVFFVDLDNLKAMNDTRGHAAGDALLRASADRIHSLVREGDIVARIGGDEILVILPGMRTLQEATAIAERVRRLLAEPVPAPDDGPPLQSTASIGVTLARQHETAETLVGRADRAMYDAKGQTDRVVSVE